jgi:glucose/arabinose dehydrogenase
VWSSMSSGGVARAGLTLLVAVAASVWSGGRAMAQITIGFEPVAAGLRFPLGVTHAGDGSGRLISLEQTGRVVVHDGSQVLPSPFLDVSALISCCDEQGLLGLAFHPRFATNGLFYVNYTNTAGDTVIARYQVSGDPNRADPASAQILLTVAQPFANHNGGQLAFGPDGFLYIALGDGGDGGDPGNRAQNLGTLLGKILRLDVDGASPYAIPADNPFRTTQGAQPEIWAYGLRNPWRFSFDRLTGDLFIADVGQNVREEVNFQPAASPGGENYGWRRMEGTLCFNPPSGCNDGTLTLPILEYDHRSTPRNCSITGGYRYRGARFPQFLARYFYGDFCSGRIWNGIQNGETWSAAELIITTFGITSFGEDEGGELYVVHHGSGTNGTLQRLVEVSQSVLLTVERTGAGTGMVVSAPEGIRCGSVCSRTFGAGAVVTLTATPAAGSVFTGWTGGGCAGTGPCTVTVAAATTVSAAFELPTVTLTVARSGSGSGTIRSADDRIGCPVTCAAQYSTGATVTLTANADPGSAFTGWSGGGCSDTGPCVVTLGADTTVTATFLQQGFTLSVATAGPGSVSSSPAGISCGATCVTTFAPATMVTLTATAEAGATFSGWSGACVGTTGLCAVTMTAARSVTATFVTSFGGAFADDPLAAGVTPVKAVHVTDLRLAIDRERTRRSLAEFAWTDPVLVPGVTPVKAIHPAEMRTALDQAYQAARLTPPTYADPAIAPGEVPARVPHVAELRAAVRGLE